MSRIVDALKKLQQQRTEQVQQGFQKPGVAEPKETRIVEQSKPNWILIACISVGILASIAISVLAIMGSDVHKDELRQLIKTVNIQEKKINNLTLLLNKVQTNSDKQLRDFSTRLDQNSKDTKIKINAVMQIDNDHYVKLKESILDNKQQLDIFDKDIKKIERKIEEMTTPK